MYSIFYTWEKIVAICDHTRQSQGNSVHATTSGHRLISAQFMRVTNHVYTCTVKMSDQAAVVKRRSVLRTTVDKWIAENDKALNTTVWLKYNTDPANRTRIISLKCSIFKHRLIGRRNYSSAFVDGSGNLQASSFKDHTASNMHSRAMLLLKKTGMFSPSPIKTTDLC